MSVRVIIGPPGTGKTSALLEIVRNALDRGISPKRIGFVSFTRKAAWEAIDRAQMIFDLPRKSFAHFRTLHSLAFGRLGYTRARVMNRHQLYDFALEMGYDLTIDYFDEEMRYVGASDDDKALQAINLSRVKVTTLGQEARRLDVDTRVVKEMSRALEYFKKQRGLVDFVDMIQQFCLYGHAPELDLLCVDEAQDLSHIQWQMVNKLMESANETYFAGDDDQAIFQWAGADTEQFQAVVGASPTRVLGQSYRVPVAVQRVANQVIGRVKHSVDKAWSPRSFEGSSTYHHNWTDLPLESDQWLVLGRNSYLLREVHAYVDEHEARDRIKVSTIHHAKGGEADNVILFTDVAKRTFDQIDTDEEHRVWYVAVTRARNSLYIIEPQTKYYYEV